jgi:hypothetical protein
MADPNTELKQTAIQVANDIQGHQLALKRELQELEARIAEINNSLESGSLARERSSNFTSQVEGEYQCPVCWVQSEQKAGLRPVSNPDSNDDIFSCRGCGREFVFPQ